MSAEESRRFRPPDPVIEIFKVSLMREIGPVIYPPYTFRLSGLDIFQTLISATAPKPITEPPQWFPRKVRIGQLINAIQIDGFPFDRLPYNHALQLDVDKLVNEWVRLKLVECVESGYRLSNEGRWLMTYVVADIVDMKRIQLSDWE